MAGILFADFPLAEQTQKKRIVPITVLIRRNCTGALADELLW
jgi:hypothetical protein